MTKPSQIKNNIAELMGLEPETRNNDNLLVHYYWKRYDQKLPQHCTQAGAIIRVRRDLCESEKKQLKEAGRMGLSMQPKYLPTNPKVCKSRRIKEEDYYNFYSH